MTTLVLVVKKIESENKTKYHTFYSHSEAKIIINENDIDVFQSIFTTIISNIQKSLRKGSCWIIDSVIDHISISKFNHLTGSSYIKLTKELDHPRKGFINIQNVDDNECFKWYLVRHVNTADHNAARIIKADKDFPKKLDFKDIQFPAKFKDIQKTEKKITLTVMFLVMKVRQNIQFMYQKNVVKKNMLIYY